MNRLNRFKQSGLFCLALLFLFLSLFPLFGCAKKEEPETVYYTVTFHSGGGSPIEEQHLAKGMPVRETAIPTREGYLFDGWKTDTGMLWDYESNFPSSDMTLNAVWIPITEIFEHDPVGDGTTVLTKLKKPRTLLDVPQTIDGLTVTAIADGVFADLSHEKVTRITLPQTVTSVGEDAFYGCEGIEISFDPRAVLSEIGAGAFFGCDALGAIRLGEGLSRIASDTFFGCSSLKEIVLPKSLALLEDNAFADCTKLITVTFHETLTEIGDSAFKDCDSLRTLYFYGTDGQITSLRENGTSNQNDAFLRATAYFYSETKPEDTGNYWYLNENGRPKLW